MLLILYLQINLSTKAQNINLSTYFSPQSLELMSNYFPLTLNQWRIQKRPPDLQPNLTNKQNTHHHRSLVIHSLSLSVSDKVNRLTENSVKIRSRIEGEGKYQMRSSGGFKSGRPSSKMSRRLDIQQKIRSMTNRELKKQKDTPKKSKKKQLQSYVLYKNRDFSSRYKQRIQNIKSHTLFDLLVVRSPAHLCQKFVVVQQPPGYKQQQKEGESFSPYRRRKAASLQQPAVTSSVSVIDNIDIQQLRQKNNRNASVGQVTQRDKQMTCRDERIEGKQQKLFISVKEMNLSNRSSKAVMSNRRPNCLSFSNQAIQIQRRKCVAKAIRIKTQQMPIAPWDTQQRQKFAS